jgi:hypothetical protein
MGTRAVAPEGSLEQLPLEAVREAYRDPLALKGDYARANASMVALAASLGLLTVLWPCADDHYTNAWRPTPKGLRVLFGDTDASTD